VIKNERQYRITRAQARVFEEALAELDAGADEAGTKPGLVKVQRDALRSQLATLTAELDEYEALVSGQRSVLQAESIEELPRALIQARIATGLTQKDLADRLEVKEQQVQRYEASEYASASLHRLAEVSRALGIKVRQDILLPRARASLETLFRRLRDVELDRDFVMRRLAPRLVAARVEAGAEGELDALQVAARVGRVFGWTVDDIFSDSPLRLAAAHAGPGRFKAPTRADERRLNAYAVYARFLATALLDATPHLSPQRIPGTPDAARRAIVSAYGSVDLEGALRYVWDLGIPVLPLADRGAFHGACWRIAGRNVIALKQKTSSAARWLFDLFHELWHCAQRPDQEDLAVVEASSNAREQRCSPEEEAASRFADDILLKGRSVELAGSCLREAQGRPENLKTAVKRVALREGVLVGALANYVAFHLSRQGVNWWGAATNLQQLDSAPWQTGRDLVLERANLGRLGEVDRELLVQALSNDGAEA
jgi:transcriptional regulator with XRE-family HTH domain